MTATTANGWHELSARQSRWQRHEVKYLIDEEQARLVRRYCQRYLPIDPYAENRQDWQYPILSVYFDSPGRALLFQALHRLSFRFKLRVRTYRMFCDNGGSTSAFLEIKRKVQGIVQKTRALIGRDAASGLVEYGVMALPGQDGRQSSNVAEFLTTCRQIAARPVVGVFYEREAYEGHTDERVRITLDRNMHSGWLGTSGGKYHEVWRPVHTAGVILEVKFTNTYPFWLSDMLHRLELLRCGVCKYITCTQALHGAARWVEAGEPSWSF